MSHPQIEEVSDSDPDDMDPSDFLPSSSGPPIAPASSSTSAVLPHRPSAGLPDAMPLAPLASDPRSAAYQAQVAEARAEVKEWHCLYPIYFDATRSRSEGRRVEKDKAVENPLAYEIAEAARHLGLPAMLEALRTHPKDWANPGRVKIQLKGAPAHSGASKVKNKHHLYRLVADWLKTHPTTEKSPLKLKVPIPNAKVVAPAVPRGWSMSSILPLHSPAMTGGGVSENMFKDMMQEMQEQGGPAALGQGGAGGLGDLLGAMGGAGSEGRGGGGGGGGGGGEEKKSKKDKKKNKA